MPEGDFSDLDLSGCGRSLVVGGAIVAALLLLAIAMMTSGCASTGKPDPLPRPQPAPQVITDRVPLYDPCPPPPLLPRPMLWPLLVDGITATGLPVKLVVLESYIHSLMAWGDDQATILEPYRAAATHPPAPVPTLVSPPTARGELTTGDVNSPLDEPAPSS